MWKLRSVVLLLIGLVITQQQVNPGYFGSEEILPVEPKDPPFYSIPSEFADSLMRDMSLEQKIAQMIMVQAYSNGDEQHLASLIKLVKKKEIGGIIFFQGGPLRQANITNKLQEISKIPLLVAMDAEWGLDMRLDSVIGYPKQMVLGAIRDNNLLYDFGKDLAEQLKTLGVQMNFAPVADINNNPANPVINTRSFGENRVEVGEKVNAVFNGMQSEGILVTAKHFPGHGDTNVDSHIGLPVLNFDFNRLDSLELYPFKEAVKAGLSGIMVAHLNVPALDSRPGRPTTLSRNVVTDLLKEKMGFKGLVVTDALNMKGASQNFVPGEIDAEAVKAGNDILLMPANVSKAINSIKRAVKRGEISNGQIDESCRKILMAKAWVGLDTLKYVRTEGLVERLNDRKYLKLQHQLAAATQTLLRNRDSIIPLHDLEGLRLATINIGVEQSTPFTRMLDLYHTADHFFFNDPPAFPADTVLAKLLSGYNTLIVSTYYTRSFGNNYDIPRGVKEFVNGIEFKGKTVFSFFGYPYALDVVGPLDNMDALLISYTNDDLQQEYAAQAIYGGSPVSGILPVTVGEMFTQGSGIDIAGPVRLGYADPELVGMNYDTLAEMEKIVQHAIASKAMPGCQLLVARKGKVVWNKAYGFHTYRNRQQVKESDIYDIASLTKIVSTIPSLMRLQDQGLFYPDSTLGYYWNFMDTSAMKDLKISDILTHQAGLTPWIPFYYSTIEPLDSSQSLISNNWSYTYSLKIGPSAYANRNTIYKDSVYEHTYSEDYPVQVAENLYMRSDYRDTIYKMILQSPLGKKEYKYSDLGYYFLYKVVEDLTDTLFYPYNWFTFYAPLGAETTGFLPLNRFEKKRIVPTENDLLFRRQLIQGYVHDPGAAMLGGVCGHAGIFSDANDLAKLLQMYLNGGTYGGEHFIDSSTLASYTACRFPDTDNRRGLGFDRPILDEDDAGPVCNEASASSYGHSGFTGTIAWVDPKYDLIYIFLSNRVHPNQSNTKLISLNVRTDIQSLIYRSIEDQDIDAAEKVE